MFGVAGPVADAAEGRLIVPRQGIGPDLFAGDGVQRHDAAIGCGQVHDAPHFDGRGGRAGIGSWPTAWAERTDVRCRVHMVGPGQLEIGDIGWGDLGEGRETRAAIIVAIIGPI